MFQGFRAILGFDHLGILSILCSLLVAGSAHAQTSRVPDTASGVFRGDMNFDGRVNSLDISPFALGLKNEAEYKRVYLAPPEFMGDADDNGSLDYGDIDEFGRLLSPFAPNALKYLHSNIDLGIEIIAATIMSRNGRYVIQRPYLNFFASLELPIIIKDTYTDTQISVYVPKKFGFDGYVYGNMSISGSGRYLAIAGINYVDAEKRSAKVKVFRYDLITGEAILVPGEQQSFYPYLSNNGTKMSFRGFEGDKQFIYVTDFKSTRRYLELLPVTWISPNDKYPEMSDDGRFVLAPYPASLDSLYSGVILYDTVTGQETVIVSDLKEKNPIVRGGFRSTKLTRDGRYILYSLTNGNIYLYDTKRKKNRFITDRGGYYSLAISDDARYVTVDYQIFDLHRNKIASKITADAPYMDNCSLSADGRYVTGRSYVSSDEQSTYFGPNPLYIAPSPYLPGDFDNDGCVSGLDIMLWQAAFGSSVTPGTGADANHDGTVDNLDLEILDNYYGDCK